MIVLDTNVLSELMKPTPSERAMEWLGGQTVREVFTTTVTEAEIRFGIALLPDGRRRRSLAAATRRQLGRPIGQLDAQIAAIAHSRGASLATRNTADFEGCGVVVVNPWGGG